MSDETTGLLTAAERSACVAYLASTETSEQLRLVFRFASDRMGIAATIDTIHLVLRLDDHARALLAAAEARGVARGHADEWQRAVRICDRYAREYGHAVAAEIADAIRAGRTTPPATGATEGVREEVEELTLCESRRTLLLPGVLYRFTAIVGCPSCAAALAACEADPTDRTATEGAAHG